MKQEVLIGQVDYSVLVMMRDDAGAPATGLAHTDIDIAYARVETDNDVTTSDVAPANLGALTDAHSDWGWEEVSSTDHPGVYRLDIADAVFASGAWSAVVSVTGTGLDPAHLEFILVPSAPLSGVLLAPTTHTSAVIPTVTTTGTATNLTNLPTIPANWLTAAGTHSDFTTEIQAGLATSAALAVVDGIVDDILLDTAEIGAAGAGLTNINLPNQTMDIVGNITGNLSGSVGSVTGAVGSVTGNVGGNVTGSVGSVATGGISAASFAAGAITATVIATDAIDNDAIAANAVTEIQSGLATASALSTAQTDITAIKAKTDNLPSDPADASVIAGRFDTLDTSIADIPTVAEFEARTLLAAAYGTAANQTTIITAIDALPTNAELATALTNLDAAVSTRATPAQILTTALTEAYAADGAAPTLSQFMYMVWAELHEFSISGTTITSKKLDKSTTAMTHTLNSSTTPTSRTRAT